MTVTIRHGDVTMRTNADEIVEMFRAAPKETAIQLRDAVARMFQRWNKDVRAQAPAFAKKLERRGAFTFRVRPGKSEIAAKPTLDISGNFNTRSRRVLAHEFGATIRPTGAEKLAVPVGKFRRMSSERRKALGLTSPREYQRLGTGSPLFVRKSRRGGGRSAVLVRATGQTTKTGKARVETVFVLKRQVVIPASLGLRKVWDGLAFHRARTVRTHLDRVIETLARTRFRGRGRRGLAA